MNRKKRNAPAVVAHRTGAKEKYLRTYNSTTFRKAQAIKKRRREMVMEFAALPVVLAVFAGLFWIMWSLRGVV